MIIPEVLQDKINQELSKVWTGLYGKIDSYDKASLTAKVKPLLKVPTEDGFQELPILVKLPVNVFHSGGVLIVPDYKRNDLVYLAPSPHPIKDSIRSQFGKTQNSLDQTEAPSFSLENCSVIGGVPNHPFQLPPTVQKDGLVICDTLGNSYILISSSLIEFKSGLANTEKAVLGETLEGILTEILDALSALTVPCTAPGTNSLTPVNASVFASIKAKLSTILSQKVKNN
nr:Gp138 family membrane-puncturing spike protein [Leptospira interrogans]